MEKRDTRRPTSAEKNRAAKITIASKLLSVSETVEILHASGSKRLSELGNELDSKKAAGGEFTIEEIDNIWKALDEVISKTEDNLSNEIYTLELTCAKLVLEAWRSEVQKKEQRQPRGAWLKSLNSSNKDMPTGGLTIGDGIAAIADAAKYFALALVAVAFFTE